MTGNNSDNALPEQGVVAQCITYSKTLCPQENVR